MKLTRIEREPSLEDWMEYWLEELKEAGYVLNYTKSITPFVLTKPVVVRETFIKVLYKGTKRERSEERTKDRTLLNGSTYKPDFIVSWARKADGVFVTMSKVNFMKGEVPFFATTKYTTRDSSNSIVTPIDVKSPFRGKNCSDATFSLNRKIVFKKYDVFVNKAILMPNKKLKKPGEYLFARTFTPFRFKYTSKTLVLKSIKYWKVLSLEEFLSSRLLKE